MRNFEQTIISQYDASSIIRQLIANMNDYIDPTADFTAFHNLIWNVDSAEGLGLNIWGRIVGVQRNLTVPSPRNYFGFKATTPAPWLPFNYGTFDNVGAGHAPTQVYALSDTQFRTLIMAKALANISRTSPPALNQLVTNLFAGRGRAYVLDLGHMMMLYRFEFLLNPYEVAIITQSGAIPHTSGVRCFYQHGLMQNYLGFKNSNPSKLNQYKPTSFGGFFSSDNLKAMA